MEVTERSRTLTCLACPRGCRVKVELDEEGGVLRMEGSRCERGEEWLRREILNPTRTLTTTVRTVFPDFPRLSVKTNRDVPLKEFFDFMKKIDSVLVERRLKPGDVVVEDFYKDEEGFASLVATGYMEEKS